MRKKETVCGVWKDIASKDYNISFQNDTHYAGKKKHSHDYYELHFVTEGNISMLIKDTAFPLSPGDMVLIPPGVFHQPFHSPSDIPYKRFIFSISQNYLAKLTSISIDYTYLINLAQVKNRFLFHFDTIAFNTVCSKIISAIKETHSERFGKEIQIQLCVNDLILHLNRSIYEMDHPIAEKDNTRLYNSLIQYIENHINEDLTLEYLSNTFFVSKFHILHMFKEYSGISLHQYITKKRLEMCKNAIMRNDNITKVFTLYGFHDYTSFYRAFKKEYGISPKQYKELHLDNSRSERPVNV